MKETWEVNVGRLTFIIYLHITENMEIIEEEGIKRNRPTMDWRLANSQLIHAKLCGAETPPAS